MRIEIGKKESVFKPVPYKKLVPYQNLIIKFGETVSLNNPVGLGVFMAIFTLLCFAFHLFNPPVVSSLALIGLAYVWIEWGFGFFADDDAIVEDERLKEIYHKYVYVSTYLTKITETMAKYKKDSEQVYLIFVTLALLGLMFIASSINNILLIWAFTACGITCLAALLDGDVKIR